MKTQNPNRCNMLLLLVLFLVALISSEADAQGCSPDLTTPRITCANPDTFYATPGECHITKALNLTPPVYSDNCDDAANLILSNNLHAPPYLIGTIDVYWKVRDAQGNSGACNTNIVVMDSTSMCP